MTPTTSETKPRFFLRLGTLIIIQVVFVFAALALIVYLPHESHDIGTVAEDLQGQLETIAQPLAGRTPPTTLPVDGNDFAGLAIVGRTDTEITRLDHFVRDAQAGSSESIDPVSLAGARMLAAWLDQPEGFRATLLSSEGGVILAQRINLADNHPAVVVGVTGNNMLVSNRTYITTVLLILFLASVTISILTVALIRRRFQWPLERLMRGLERTADGELFVMSENFDDKELDELATSFNRMSQRLWENHRELTAYNRRLKKMNVSLLESQLFFSTLVESSPLCIIVTSPKGQILLFNRQACDDFGYAAGDAAGKNINELFAGLASGQKVKLAMADDGAAFEARCRKRGGEFFPAYIISRPARGRDGSIAAYIYIIKNISESKGFQDMMVRLDRYYTRGEMAGDIAHEINNYLSILMGNIELLPMILKKGDEEKVNKKLGIMKDTTDKIARFADGLMEGPQDEAKLESTDLNQLVANVLAFLKPQNKFDDIELDADLSCDVPLVDLDSGQVQQLLVNFVYNAAEAVQQLAGDRRIRVRTVAESAESGDTVRVEVIDNGPGVPDDKRAFLFERRFTTKRKGHGIGLITCRKIVEVHGGHIGYEQREGAVFYFVLPVRTGSAAPTGDRVAVDTPATAAPVSVDSEVGATGPVHTI
ncbi:PAS domain S-box protein [candidate division GN15 bacterium]|nr:PAS domain S-box protein [candidate division GN15 bacterium]